MGDEFGDRIKQYEAVEAGRRLMPLLPIIARLDGRNFSTFTRGLQRPYDERLHKLMVATTGHLIKEADALVGYTQSDEISLILYSPDYRTQIWFDGKIQKIVSQLAAQASVYFNKNLKYFMPEKADCMPTFDCRVWNMPNQAEATNAILWREQDATKNSVSMAARHYYSHTEVDGKNRADMMEMLFQKGVNWSEYPDWFKRGSYIRRIKTSVQFTREEFDALPPMHLARARPDLAVERHVIGEISMPPLARVVNRVGVLFSGAEPVATTDLINKCNCVDQQRHENCSGWSLPREL